MPIYKIIILIIKLNIIILFPANAQEIKYNTFRNYFVQKFFDVPFIRDDSGIKFNNDFFKYDLFKIDKKINLFIKIMQDQNQKIIEKKINSKLTNDLNNQIKNKKKIFVNKENLQTNINFILDRFFSLEKKSQNLYEVYYKSKPRESEFYSYRYFFNSNELFEKGVYKFLVSNSEDIKKIFLRINYGTQKKIIELKKDSSNSFFINIQDYINKNIRSFSDNIQLELQEVMILFYNKQKNVDLEIQEYSSSISNQVISVNDIFKYYVISFEKLDDICGNYVCSINLDSKTKVQNVFFGDDKAFLPAAIKNIDIVPHEDKEIKFYFPWVQFYIWEKLKLKKNNNQKNTKKLKKKLNISFKKNTNYKLIQRFLNYSGEGTSGFSLVMSFKDGSIYKIDRFKLNKFFYLKFPEDKILSSITLEIDTHYNNTHSFLIDKFEVHEVKKFDIKHHPIAFNLPIFFDYSENHLRLNNIKKNKFLFNNFIHAKSYEAKFQIIDSKKKKNIKFVFNNSFKNLDTLFFAFSNNNNFEDKFNFKNCNFYYNLIYLKNSIEKVEKNCISKNIFMFKDLNKKNVKSVEFFLDINQIKNEIFISGLAHLLKPETFDGYRAFNYINKMNETNFTKKKIDVFNYISNNFFFLAN